MTLTSLCLAARPLLVSGNIASARGLASLSGIHRGLRKSERARPQGPRSSDRDDGKPMTYRERQEARAAAPKPDFKIRKGKKDITEYPDEVKPQSRRARFFDPDSSFGKKSLVYQLKTGKLREELGFLAQKDSRGSSDRPSRSDFGGGTDVFSDKIRAFGGAEEESRGPRDRSRSGGDSRRSFDRGGRGGSRGGSRGSKDFGAPRERSLWSGGGDARAEGRPEGRPGMWSSRGSGESRGPRRGGWQGTDPRDFSREFERRPARDSGEPRDRQPRDQELGDREPREMRERPQPTRGVREFGDDRGPREKSDRDNNTNSSPRGFERREFTPSQSRFSSSEEGPTKREQREQRDYPVSIPYTSAASQFLYGKSVVEAALGGRRKLYKLYIYRGRNQDANNRHEGLYKESKTAQDISIERLAQHKQVETVILGEAGLRLMDKMSGGRPHNNYVLEASPLPQLPVTSLGAVSGSDVATEAKEVSEAGADAEVNSINTRTSTSNSHGFFVNLAHQSAEEAAITGTNNFISTTALGKVEPTHKPLVIVLHGVLDPGNVGAILRSASFLGANAVAMTKRGSAPLTPVALKAAAGASETLTLFAVDSVERFLDESRANGWAVYAAVPPPANGKHSRPHLDVLDVEDADPLREKPCILLMGSEGEGLSKALRKRADFDVNIPNAAGSEVVDSLNVSVAAGLLCHAFLKGKVAEKMAREKEEERKFALF